MVLAILFGDAAQLAKSGIGDEAQLAKFQAKFDFEQASMANHVGKTVSLAHLNI